MDRRTALSERKSLFNKFLPFKVCETRGISETFGEGVAVDLQFRNLADEKKRNINRLLLIIDQTGKSKI